jgi:hypothetical protein
MKKLLAAPTPAPVTPRRGRPRKFSAPSRAVTLTLPDDVIAALGAVDPDLSRAVVRLVLPEVGRRAHPPAELTPFGRHAVIVVTPSRTLARQAGVTLVPLPDGRALISFEQPTTLSDLELHLEDALRTGRLSVGDRAVFEGIADILRSARRSSTVALRQHHIIVLEAKRAARRSESSSAPVRRRRRA